MGLRSENDERLGSKLKEWPTRRIAFLVYSSAHLMNLAGPLDVFTRASAALSRSGKRRSPAYKVALLTHDEMPLLTGSGLGLIGGRRWTEVHDPIDTLLVLASADVAQARIDPDLLAWVRSQANQVRRI
jgi:transcriptional regulator GlxA family with amidase domain